MCSTDKGASFGLEGMSMEMSHENAKVSTEKKAPHLKMAQNDEKTSPEKQKGLIKASQPTANKEPSYEISANSTSDAVNVGTNMIEISITDLKDKKPVIGLKLKAHVFMTSLDMGTEEPRVKETARGKYQVNVHFAMKGPWAVMLILPNGKEKILNFDVPSK
jgi:hypothetical protein